MPPGLVLLVFAGVPALSVVYYLVATRFAHSPLSLSDDLAFLSVIAAFVTGGYQVFFWVQRNNTFFPSRHLACRLDDAIPFWPSWVWVYSIVYFIAMAGVVLRIRSLAEGVRLLFGGLVLLTLQSALSMLIPCATPPRFREYEVTGPSTRYLKQIQGFDNGRNCFPSLHCGLAAFIGAALWPYLHYWSAVFVAAIAISCLFVKQHQLADIIPGVLLGWAVFAFVCG